MAWDVSVLPQIAGRGASPVIWTARDFELDGEMPNFGRIETGVAVPSGAALV
jgi:hypothetical protein